MCFMSATRGMNYGRIDPHKLKQGERVFGVELVLSDRTDNNKIKV